MAREINQEDSWETFIDDGYRAYLKGCFHEAEELYEAAFALAVRARIFAHTSVARIFFLLGDLYCDRKDYRGAEVFYRQALTVYEMVAGPAGIDESVTIKRISEMCRAQGKEGEAFKMRRRADQLLTEERQRLDCLLLKSNAGADG